MEAELAKLRQQLLEEQQQRKEAERQREEEQRRRQEAEELTKASQPQTLQAYLEACHSLSLAIQIGTMTFESHTNLGETNDSLSKHLDRMFIERNDTGQPPPASRPPSRKPRRKARGKGNRADQFCIYHTSNGRNIPAIAIKYKAPHKLGRNEVVTGLASEIQPERDVINKDGSRFAFTSRALTSAIVTQLFSYMIGKGIQYGYVCTGEVLVFLYIPDDPSTIYYHMCVPNLDVLDGDENRLHRTAIAQVFAFIIQALRAEPPPPSWHDAAAALNTWAVEYNDVLQNIPKSLAGDRGRNADATPLYLAGRIRALFKVQLSSYSYTLVAKGVETVDLGRLQHENDVYNRLQPIQGIYTPICLSRVDLVLPYYYNSGVFKHFLFLS
ncbi:hypothetical protein CCHR01_16990 [Colletotrichum chrysophilum]|uniref:Uncharacterized protein n=1 Tax=Colletotrichum chrysophilum TaxID=1836956 RepID=A0AAD9A2S8_9PEZI|nr:hypothetical protein CCHR01_16990 [Colletotrichum chrysophilum]